MEYATTTANWVQSNVHDVNPPPQNTYSATYSSQVPGNSEIPTSTSYLCNSSVAGGTHDYAHSIDTRLNQDPSRVDSAFGLTSHTIGHPGVEPQSGIHYSHLHMVNTQSLPAAYGYYLGPNSQNWASAQNVAQYQSHPVGYSYLLSEHSAEIISISANGSGHLGFANPGSTGLANPIVFPHGTGHQYKRLKKTTKKIVEAAFCEVCKINCNSKDILVQHKQGKKHKKNLEKLRQSLGPLPVAATVSSNPASQPKKEENIGLAANSRKNKKKASGSVKDLESKRRKIIDGGAAAESVRTCPVCNVVCNSDTVFSSHLAGRMHANMEQKLASQTK